jgi:NTP pyrophosphatase (non-canonical NTP hydrolase)
MNNEAIKKIADTYGFYEQSRQLLEECAELIVAVNKAYRLKKSNVCPFFDEMAIEMKNAFNNVVEEIADVTIMLEQIKYLLKLNDNDIELFIDQKLNRQLERIEKNE